jgi:hypothetical protein
VPARLTGAALAMAVALVHVIDQGGFPGDKDPAYVGKGYYLLELAGVLVAAALVLAREVRLARLAWCGAALVALGPLAGYIASRGPGLPDYTDDKGAWTEPLGLVSIVVEVALLVLALAAAARSRD